MIRSTSLRSLPILLFYQIMKAILGKLSSIPFADAGLKTLLQDMQITFKDFDAAIRPVQGSVHTQNLLDLDALRDSLITGLIGILRQYDYSNNAAKRDAARLLMGFYNVYGKELAMAQLPQAEETAAITNFLQDLKRPDAVAALGQLSFLNADWIAPLATANTQFEALYSTRNTDTFLAEAGVARKHRKELQDLFKDFGKRINAMLVMNSTDAMALDAAKAINAEVQNAKDTYRPGKGGGDAPQG